jgi:hypothetical protein
MQVCGNRARVKARNVAIAGMLMAALGVALSATASASTWVGTARGTIQRSNDLVSGGTRWQGTFRINVGRGGAVHGYATVGYTPNIDVSGLDDAINYLRSDIGAGFGLLGPFGNLVASAGLGTIEGVRVSFREAMAIRSGTLRGTFDGGRLALHWNARLKSRPIPYEILLTLVGGHKQIGSGTAPLLDPFTLAASLVQNGEAVASSESNSSSGGLAQQVDSYWVAHRVS